MPPEDLVIELGQGEVLRPDDGPRMGDRRRVKLVQMPWNAMAPCLWRSPNAETVDGQRGHWCVVLADKGGITAIGGEISKPQTYIVFVPDVLWDHLPEDVVEW